MATMTDVADKLQQLYPQAYSLTKNKADTEDLLQNTFVQACRYLHTYKAENLSGWLYTMMRNLFITGRKSPRVWRMVSLERLPGLEVVCMPTAASEWDAVRILEKIEQLTPDHQAVLRLVAADASYIEMQAALGVPVGTVKSRISRAREALMKQLQNSPPTH